MKVLNHSTCVVSPASRKFVGSAHVFVACALRRGRKATLRNQISSFSLTEPTHRHSIRFVQVRRSTWSAKRESGTVRRFDGEANPELPPQLLAVSSSLTCHWVLRCKAWEGGEGRRPASQETCLSESSFRRAGRAIGADFRCGDKSTCHMDGGPLWLALN